MNAHKLTTGKTISTGPGSGRHASSIRLAAFLLLFTILPGSVFPQQAQTIAPLNTLSHQRHSHKYGPPFETDEITPERFQTSRRSPVRLFLPRASESFSFVVFGDRAGGRPEGVDVLADAVRDTNLLEPDFVMTVGDMILGYTAGNLWERQMSQYKTIMNELNCPWFPVAGNHDILTGNIDHYHKGPEFKYHNEERYEKHFGPLWYAFEYEGCRFIVLFNDEGDRETGVKDLFDPKHYRFSREQFDWLASTLAGAGDARHVFVFQHQPWWQDEKKYGSEWNRIHRLLVEAGNVRAVFAGHHHRTHYVKKDGIEYVTLSTTGANVPTNHIKRIGNQDNILFVQVRRDRFSMSSVPVGVTMDPREWTSDFTEDIERLFHASLKCHPALAPGGDGKIDDTITLPVRNISAFPIEIESRLRSEDSRWEMSSYPQKVVLSPDRTNTFSFKIDRPSGSIDQYFHPPYVSVKITVLTPGSAVSFPEKKIPVSMDLDSLFEKRRFRDQAVLRLGTPGDCLRLPMISLAPGEPFTVECWFRPEKRSLHGKIALVWKGAGRRHDLGLFLLDGLPSFHVLSGVDSFIFATSPKSVKASEKIWRHMAGVSDREEIRLYFNGKKVSSTKWPVPFPGDKRPATLGLMDIISRNTTQHEFTGELDSVRFSRSARYVTDAFEPERNFENDQDTLLLLDMQTNVGRQVRTSNPQLPPAELGGDAGIVFEKDDEGP